MYTEPQSVTISGTAISLPRTGVGTTSGQFNTPDGTTVLKVSQAIGKRNRRTARVESSKVAVDPLTAMNQKFSMSAYIVVDTPPTGFTVAEAQAVVTGLCTWLTASTGANIAKLLGGEV